VVERSLALPGELFRRLITPAARGAVARFVGAAVSTIRRRTREPALPRMSEEWLRHLDHDAGRRLDSW